MTQLPHSSQPFAGDIQRLLSDSTPASFSQRAAPTNAPNVLLIMLDDVGFGSMSTFGGPVPSPALQRVADEGLSYNQFHTTALCSPTRAALRSDTPGRIATIPAPPLRVPLVALGLHDGGLPLVEHGWLTGSDGTVSA